MAKFCKKCGAQLNDNASFCPGCGEQLSAPQAPPVQQQSAPPPVQQQYYAPPQQQQYYAPPPAAPKKKFLKPLIIAGSAVAAILVVLIIIGSTGDGVIDAPTTEPPEEFNVEAFVETPGGRDLPFEIGESGFTTNDPMIKMIEINQALSYGFDTETGEFYLLDNFVAGKETGIFIDLESPPDPASEISLTIEKDGEFVTSLQPIGFVDETTLLFQPKDLSEVGDWEKGAYAFILNIDDSEAIRTTNFFEAMPVKVYAVPVKANYGGRIVSCLDDWKDGWQMLSATYPVAKENLEYIMGPEIDLSDPMYDLTTRDGMYYVWDALVNLQTPNEDYTLILGYVRDRVGDSGSILGYTWGLPANIIVESERDMIATVPHEVAHCYKIGDEYEDGSLCNLFNPPPYRMPGHDIFSGQPTQGYRESVIGGYQYGINASGSVIYPQQRAYWAAEKELLGTVTSYMGEGTGEDAFTMWTTSDIWNHLFSVYTGQSEWWTSFLAGETQGEDPGGGGGTGGTDYWGQCFNCYGQIYDTGVFAQCRHCMVYTEIDIINENGDFDCYGCGKRSCLQDYYQSELYVYCPLCDMLLELPYFNEFNSGSMDKTSDDATADAMADTKVIKITGLLEDDTFTPATWYTYETSDVNQAVKMEGEYSVRMYDADGELLSVTYFDAVSEAQITTDDGQAFIDDPKIPLSLIIELPEDAVKISILKGEQELFSRNVSNSVPEVAFTGLTEGQELEGITTLTWEASDADGDELTFEIWYNPREDELYQVACGIEEMSYEADLTGFPGTKDGYFTIYATDGILTGEAVSPKVSLPYLPPEILNIMPDVTEVKVTEAIELVADVYDQQDGWLLYEGISWYVDGEFFMDNLYFWQFPYMLAPGLHTVTCEATNSGGQSTSRDFVYEVIDDESDLPDDWSFYDVVTALCLGFSLPLDRLDAPVTRIEFADLMFNLQTLVLPDDFEDIPMFLTELPEITDLSDKDYLMAFIMLNYGLMDAPDGLFDPQGSLTEREAMMIMYKTIRFGRDPGLTPKDLEGVTEEECIAYFTELGLFDEETPNVYDPDEKITRKTILVRIGKFIINEFELDSASAYENRFSLMEG